MLPQCRLAFVLHVFIIMFYPTSKFSMQRFMLNIFTAYFGQLVLTSRRRFCQHFWFSCVGIVLF